MSETKEVREIEVDIPIEKINDLVFIQSKFIEVCFKTLKELSNHSEKSFPELVKQFIPDKDCISDEILSEWGLSKSDLENSDQQTETEVVVNDPTVTETPVVEKPKKAKSIKKKIKKRVRKIKKQAS